MLCTLREKESKMKDAISTNSSGQLTSEKAKRETLSSDYYLFHMDYIWEGPSSKLRNKRPRRSLPLMPTELHSWYTPKGKHAIVTIFVPLILTTSFEGRDAAANKLIPVFSLPQILYPSLLHHWVRANPTSLSQNQDSNGLLNTGQKGILWLSPGKNICLNKMFSSKV